MPASTTTAPSSRELVRILLAQRAVLALRPRQRDDPGGGGRGAHVLDAARLDEDEKALLVFEQHLYLRQPGYGTSYVTGKYLLERTLVDYAKQHEGLPGTEGETFRLRDFFDRLHAIGNIRISLARWEMPGLDDEIERLAESD